MMTHIKHQRFVNLLALILGTYKISKKNSATDHEMGWEESIERLAGDSKNHHLVPLKKLEFDKSAIIQTGNLSGGLNDLSGDYGSGILMEKYQSALSRCNIPLREAMLLKYGEQLKKAVAMMHDCG